LEINKYFLVSNGIDLEQYNNLPDKYSWNRRGLDNRFVLLFMSRMDKEKGLDILIQAYKRFYKTSQKNDFVLLLVGPDNQRYLKSLNLNFKDLNIVYVPGIYGSDKIKVIRRSDVLILPSYNENFANIIAEALACERPVITTTGTPWKDIEKIGCGYYIEPNENELFKAIQKVYSLSRNDREIMGKIGREYVINNYDWQVKSEEIYNNILRVLR
jgi:glycosyltransferase involved in cell wall biosynthesis